MSINDVYDGNKSILKFIERTREKEDIIFVKIQLCEDCMNNIIFTTYSNTTPKCRNSKCHNNVMAIPVFIESIDENDGHMFIDINSILNITIIDIL